MSTESKSAERGSDGGPRQTPTPGPWYVEWPKFDANVFDDQGLMVAVVRIDDQWRPASNAWLIAAAPDLLAAAKLTASHFKRMQAIGNFQGDNEHEAWAALEKAIAKAEGSS